MDINTVTLTGNIGTDLELRHTKTGTAVTEFNLAVTSGFGDTQKTNWIGLTLWGKTAESAHKFLGKGRKIAVSGRLDQSSYEDKDGKKQSKTRVTVESWTFADSKRQDEGDSTRPKSRGSESYPRQEMAPDRPAETARRPDDEDDDIPF